MKVWRYFADSPQAMAGMNANIATSVIRRALEWERNRLQRAGKSPDSAIVNDKGEWRASEQGRPWRRRASTPKSIP